MNREEWLTKVGEIIEPWFDKPIGPWRITCSWPSKGARPSKNQRLGECYPVSMSSGDASEITISMAMGEGSKDKRYADPVEIAGVVAHELCHVGAPKDGHGKRFTALARHLGLEGKPTATTAGPKFRERIEPELKALGPYPHASLNLNGTKKQTTRMLKAECLSCRDESEGTKKKQGYTVRVSAKWLEAGGPPICPIHRHVMAV